MNPHPLRDTILSRARLPLRHSGIRQHPLTFETRNLTIASLRCLTLPLRHSGIRQQPHYHETSNLTNCESALPGSIITPFWQCTDSTAFVDWILDLS